MNLIKENGITITSSTLKGRNNCFSLETESKKDIRIVNFYLEDLEYLLKNGLTYPVKILLINSKIGVINDERIPDEFYNERFCIVCTHEDFLTLPQQLEIERDIVLGKRVETKSFVAINMETPKCILDLKRSDVYKQNNTPDKETLKSMGYAVDEEGLKEVRDQIIKDIENNNKIKTVINFNVTFTDSIPNNTDISTFDIDDKIVLTGQIIPSENGVYIIKTIENTINKKLVRINYRDNISLTKELFEYKTQKDSENNGK
jgi:hypothetical protein